MIQVQMKTLDDEYQVTSDDTKEVTLSIACQRFDMLIDACRKQFIRVNFERCDERSIAISTDLAPVPRPRNKNNPTMQKPARNRRHSHLAFNRGGRSVLGRFRMLLATPWEKQPIQHAAMEL